MPEIISFGEVLVDLIGKRMKGIENSFCFEKFFGGAPANYAVGCRRLGADVVFITGISNDFFGDFLLGVLKGEKGAILFEGNQKITFRGYKVKVVDTTGAGDSFSAGISVGILRGYKGRELLSFASAVAAISVQKVGAISSLPKMKEVERFLRSNV